MLLAHLHFCKSFYIKPQLGQGWLCSRFIVSSFVSTSNHNGSLWDYLGYPLYLLLFLHQTTTLGIGCLSVSYCIFFCFYIKPQLTRHVREAASNCIFFCFYIKPQLSRQSGNMRPYCIFFCFYIKPQLSFLTERALSIVSSFVSTSNHNTTSFSPKRKILYLLLFLHQTTTY